MKDNTDQTTEQSETNEGAAENVAPINGSAGSALEAKLKEAEQKYVYLYADFENFKKRAVKERSDIMKFGWENVASDLLQVLDNLDRALQHASPSTDANLLAGLKMVAQQFHSTMEKQGVATIPTDNQSFNPELHEGVGQLPSEKPEGSIVQEVQKGYTLHGRLLRAARVMLSSGKAAH